jgi:hypothetical protein
MRKCVFDIKLTPITLFGILFQFACIPGSYAQSVADSLSYTESLSKIRHVYIQGIGDNAQIYHGTEFIRNGQQAAGFPFFDSDSMQTGSIYYQGFQNVNKKLHYDMVSDEVIINGYANNSLISLSPLKTDSFTIGSHLFVRLVSGGSRGLTRDGYYEELFSGEPGLFVKREKRLVVGTGSEETKYIQYDDYFIRIHTVFFAVQGKSDLLELFKDRKDDVAKYIRSHKLNFKKNLEVSLLSATMYYSGLKQ